MKSNKFIKTFPIIIVAFAMAILTRQNVFAEPSIDRIAGQDRYATAAQVSNSGWKTSKNVVIVNGTNFPDGLSAAPLAKKLDAPILLSEKDSLTTETANSIKSLQPEDIYIIGGTGVVSDNVVRSLNSFGSIRIHRISGQDRYGTSTAVANYMFSSFGTSDTVFVASGAGFADALSAAPIAAQMGAPILLSPNDALADTIKQFINSNNIKKTYVIGGTGVISDSILKSFPAPQRIWGQNRYETNISVVDYFKSFINYSNVFISSGENFPDALSSSVLIAKESSALILTPEIPSLHSRQYCTELINSGSVSDVNTFYVIGGTGVVPDKTVQCLIAPTNTEGTDFNNFWYHADVTEQGNIIYYSAKDSNSASTGAIYKMQADGSNKIQLIHTDGIPYDINVVGDWVYYINQTSKTVNYYGNYTETYVFNTIYRVKTDGSNNVKLSSDNAKGMMVIGDCIYYNIENNKYGTNSELGIYRINQDGTNKIRLYDYGNYPGYILNYTDKYIFFRLSGAGTCRINLDGSNKAQLADSDSAFYGADDWIYSIAGDYVMSSVIYREKADGTGKTTIYNGPPTNDNNPNISGDNIYFTCNDGIYRMKTDGTEIKKNYNGSARRLSIIGNYIYFRDSSESDDVIKRIDLDGSNEEIIQD